jgi:D-lactate dehydrogenase
MTTTSLPPSLPSSLSASAFTTDLITRHALAHDASHFLLIPDAVARVGSAHELVAVLAEARRRNLPVTFRSGGTSLSGQGVTDGLLVDIRRGFTNMEIRHDGRVVAVEPGVGLRVVNGRLMRLGRQLGPDPASEVACTIGGVVANNSSGMACGTTENTYKTLRSATVVLASGTIINTADEDADTQLATQEPDLYQTLRDLRDRIRGNPESVATITRLFSIKNTMGYGLNSFLDYDTPVDILLRLMVGSEGTLGFVSEAVFDTVPLRSHALTGLLVFASLEDATAALPDIVASGVAVAELMDETSLAVARQDDQVKKVLPETASPGEAALLLEYRATNADELRDITAGVPALMESLSPLPPSAFSDDPGLRQALWKVRKGLFAAVAATRPSGQLSLLEDICVPMEKLLDTVVGLQNLFTTYDYKNAVIFGHAKDGNIHFLLNQSFATADDIARFEAFTADMVDLVLGNGGTLKAEHGTGRMMAGYVRRQYGDELYEVTVAIKHAFDPAGILNPGVIISNDPNAHINNLKSVPDIEQEADSCVECGYCELVCPSKDLTLTPRQRIVIRRDITQAEADGNKALAKKLEKGFQYAGLDTCAVDGMCQTVCPVNIDTGSLVKRLRKEQPTRIRNLVWQVAAKNWSVTTRMIARGLSLAHRLPAPLVSATTTVARRLLGKSDIPQWSQDLPPGGSRRQALPLGSETEVIWLSSCTGSMFGSHTGPGAGQAFLELCERAGVKVSTMERPDGLCCGTPWSSKGLPSGLATMQEAFSKAASGVSSDVVYVSDASSCTEGYKKMAGEVGIAVVDAVEFVAGLLPSLPVVTPVETVVLHPTCSTEKLGITGDLKALAHHIASNVVVPQEWNCCGFAGDRGMLFPELTKSATASMVRQLQDVTADHYASSNKTCEIAMTRATGHDYANILELLAIATRPTR